MQRVTAAKLHGVTFNINVHFIQYQAVKLIHLMNSKDLK